MGKAALVLRSELVRAARALLRWEQADLADASSVSLPTIKRLESKPGIMAAHLSTVAALRKALEAAGVEFTDGDQPGVRLRKSAPEEAKEPAKPDPNLSGRSGRGTASRARKR
jgi:transcriptional regulator with XRE-family HTH domain